MYFSPHRNKASVASRIQARTSGADTSTVDKDDSDGYDSLWSDSEEEEFPVNPSSSSSSEVDSEEEDEEEEELSMYPNLSLYH